MNKSMLAVLLMAGCVVSNVSANRFVNHEAIKKIKASTESWKPFEVENHPFRHLSEKEIQKRFGLITPSYNSFFSFLMPKQSSRINPDKRVKNKPRLGVPTSFDSRTQWPDCVHPVTNQGSCGSCWAFASAGFLEDRFCIASDGEINEKLSTQHIVDCDFNNGGCNGGYLTAVTNHLINEGTVTETCLPYTSGDAGANGYCNYRCSSLTANYKKYGCKAGSTVLPTSHAAIQEELMTNGPMMVGFLVYEDFMSYSTGIYTRTSDTIAGGHAVKLLGWNQDTDGDLYWVLQNQWDTTWGELGYFNIYANECGLDSIAYACAPDLF